MGGIVDGHGLNSNIRFIVLLAASKDSFRGMLEISQSCLNKDVKHGFGKVKVVVE